MRLRAFLIFAAFCALAAVCISENRPPNADLPLVQSALPTARPEAVVIPWQLNTRCTVNSRNLPQSGKAIA